MCLILFLFASQIIPVNWAGLLLIVLAMGLFAAEVKVASYGLLTVSGLVAMILGAMMLVDAPIPEMRLSLCHPASRRARHGGGHLHPRAPGAVAAQRRKATTGVEGMVGQPGLVEVALDPVGWVRVQGERWRAQAEAPWRPGSKVTVVAVEGLSLKVRGGV